MLKIVFAGTPDFAATHLAKLLNQSDPHFELVGVFTQPDRPSGRGKQLAASPVKRLALDHGLSVYQPQDFKSHESHALLRELKPDLLIVVAYGLILPQAVLDIPRLGAVNVHASLLPRWRGAAPIARAIEAGDTQTGVCLMQMQAGLDTGPVIAQTQIEIDLNDTALSLEQKLAELGSTLLRENLLNLETLMPQAQAQSEHGMTYAKKLLKTEGLIDWNLPAAKLAQQCRAFTPYPVLYTHLGDTRIRILKAKVITRHSTLPAGTLLLCNNDGIYVTTGSGIFQIVELQFPGKNPITAAQCHSLLTEGMRFT